MAGATRISVVDDDQSVRESLEGFLKSMGFAVEAYAAGEEFLRADGASRTDCLILDVRMPGMSGMELQRELAARRKPIPIVFITAYGEENVRPGAVEAGAVDCLLKPFSDETLLAAIRTALERRSGGGDGA